MDKKKNEDFEYMGMAVIALLISYGVGLILSHWIADMNLMMGICLLLFVALSMIFARNYQKKNLKKEEKDA
jgi:uncharacterized membrane protein YfcA